MILIWLFSFDVFFPNIHSVGCLRDLALATAFICYCSIEISLQFLFSPFFSSFGLRVFVPMIVTLFFGFTILRNCANKEQNCCIRLVSVAKMFPDKNAKSTNERRK